MNDYIQQPKEYTKNPEKSKRTPWTESDVRALLETGKCEGHSEPSCKIMLSQLRYNYAVRNRFCNIVQEFNEELDAGRRHVHFTNEEIELITRHIVPYDRDKSACANYASINGLFGVNRHSRQPWSYESFTEYKARVNNTPQPKETAEIEPNTEFELHIEAIKTMVSGGMGIDKIMKLLNIDETTVNAFMHLITRYNL